MKALRKPTVAVAAVNRVARTHADQIAALVEIGAELAALQADARPDRDELRDLTRQRRTLLQQLAEHAAATTERPDGARSSITATLDTASLDDALRADLQRGRLTQELSPATRFVLDDDAPSPPRPAPRATKRAAPPPRDELAARRARAELEAARERADDAEESAASTPRLPPRRPSASTPRTVTSPISRPRWPTPAPSSPSSSAPSATRNEPRVARAPNATAPRRRSTRPNARSTARPTGDDQGIVIVTLPMWRCCCCTCFAESSSVQSKVWLTCGRNSVAMTARTRSASIATLPTETP